VVPDAGDAVERGDAFVIDGGAIGAVVGGTTVNINQPSDTGEGQDAAGARGQGVAGRRRAAAAAAGTGRRVRPRVAGPVDVVGRLNRHVGEDLGGHSTTPPEDDSCRQQSN